MRTLLEPAHDGACPDVLLVLLHGSFSEPEDFAREGFPRAAREAGVHAELVMAEARAAWFADGSIVDRLDASVMQPAAARGRSRIWLAGVSLGALAALGYAARRAGALAGIVMLAPYPGTREVLNEIDAAGGLARWQPNVPERGDLEREAWAWLRAGGHGALPVFCYHASGDRFAEGQRRIATTLGPGASRELPGAHDWPTWRALWGAFLAERGTALQ